MSSLDQDIAQDTSNVEVPSSQPAEPSSSIEPSDPQDAPREQEAIASSQEPTKETTDEKSIPVRVAKVSLVADAVVPVPPDASQEQIEGLQKEATRQAYAAAHKMIDDLAEKGTSQSVDVKTEEGKEKLDVVNELHDKIVDAIKDASPEVAVTTGDFSRSGDEAQKSLGDEKGEPKSEVKDASETVEKPVETEQAVEGLSSAGEQLRGDEVEPPTDSQENSKPGIEAIGVENALSGGAGEQSTETKTDENPIGEGALSEAVPTLDTKAPDETKDVQAPEPALDTQLESGKGEDEHALESGPKETIATATDIGEVEKTGAAVPDVDIKNDEKQAESVSAIQPEDTSINDDSIRDIEAKEAAAPAAEKQVGDTAKIGAVVPGLEAAGDKGDEEKDKVETVPDVQPSKSEGEAGEQLHETVNPNDVTSAPEITNIDDQRGLGEDSTKASEALEETGGKSEEAAETDIPGLVPSVSDSHTKLQAEENIPELSKGEDVLGEKEKDGVDAGAVVSGLDVGSEAAAPDVEKSAPEPKQADEVADTTAQEIGSTTETKDEIPIVKAEHSDEEKKVQEHVTKGAEEEKLDEAAPVTRAPEPTEGVLAQDEKAGEEVPKVEENIPTLHEETKLGDDTKKEPAEATGLNEATTAPEVPTTETLPSGKVDEFTQSTTQDEPKLAEALPDKPEEKVLGGSVEDQTPDFITSHIEHGTKAEKEPEDVTQKKAEEEKVIPADSKLGSHTRQDSLAQGL